MAIILRTDIARELTFAEVDTNFSNLYYSSSIDGTTLSLFFTASGLPGVPSPNPHTIDLSSITSTDLWYDGTTYLSSSLPIKVDSHITASGNISASGLLYISASENAGQTYKVLVQDTATGRVYYTGSYSTGGGGSDWYDGTTYLSSSVAIKVDGDITASGNISGSSTTGFYGQDGHFTRTVIAGLLVSSSGDVCGDNLVAATDITASGNISASGLLYASSSVGNYSDVVVQDTSTGRFYTTSSAALSVGSDRDWYDGTTFLTASVDILISSSLTVSGSSAITGIGPNVLSGSLTQGVGVLAGGTFAHAQGLATSASGDYSHAEGGGTKASGLYAHAEGVSTISSEVASHTEGIGTKIGENAYYAHAEGTNTTASGISSHTEGEKTNTFGVGAHAEGHSTQAGIPGTAGYGARGWYSHAEGRHTTTSGDFAHAEGSGSISYGTASHAEGNNTIASGSYQHVQGQFNTHGNDTAAAMIIGDGVNDSNRHDLAIFQTQSITFNANITSSGNVSASGDITANAFSAATGIFGTATTTINDNVLSSGWVSGSSLISQTHITASGNISSSATSTSSFGTYLGDGSSLTGVTATAAPAGPDTSIQFRDSSDTSGSSDFTFNKTTKSIYVNGAITASGHVSSSATSTASFGTYIGDGANLTGVIATGTVSSSIQITNLGFVTSSATSSFLTNSSTSSMGDIANANFTGSFTGSFTGDGSNLTLVSGLLSSSAQIAADISGSFNSISSSFASDIITNTTNITSLTNVTGSYATTGSNDFIGDQTITGSLEISGSVKSYRPLLTKTAAFTASMAEANQYIRMGSHVVHIASSSVQPVDIGSEFEIFQTSSTGVVAFTSASTTITLNSKSSFVSISGQFSGAILKKVAVDEWDLIGDIA